MGGVREGVEGRAVGDAIKSIQYGRASRATCLIVAGLFGG